MTCGDPWWWDNTVDPPVQHSRDNRMVVAGDWYDITKYEIDNNGKLWFWIIDNQDRSHCFAVYEEGDREGWHSFCKKYGPRDYSKWFYTPDELAVRERRQLAKKQDEAWNEVLKVLSEAL